jgi:hypothetical protein
VCSTNHVSVDPYCVDNPDFCVGGTLGSDFYTSNGTFNGSGIALATEFWNHEERKIMTVYFQHWTGQIRSIQLTPEGQWIGGGRTEVIVTDAKNATPISTVSYALNDTGQVSCCPISLLGMSKLTRCCSGISSTSIKTVWCARKQTRTEPTFGKMGP